MTQLYKNPLLRQCYDVMQAIEECGASEKLTHAVTLAGNLLRAIDAHIDSEAHAIEQARREERTAILDIAATINPSKDIQAYVATIRARGEGK